MAQVAPKQESSTLEASSSEKVKYTGTKNEVMQVAPAPPTPLKSLVEWMASGARLLSTEANREDVRQAQGFLQKWEEAHKSGEEGKRELEREEAHASSSSSPSSPVHITPHTDDDGKLPTEPPDVNAAQHKKSLAQLGRLQIADDEFVRVIRVEAKHAEYLILDSQNTVVGALFGKTAGK
jgi:hypothetical protein